MKVVCHADRRLWSLYAGLAGSLNDLNILQSSHLFARRQVRQYPQYDVSIPNGTYITRWFLTDSIYSSWKLFVETFSIPTTAKCQASAKRQECMPKCL